MKQIPIDKSHKVLVNNLDTITAEEQNKIMTKLKKDNPKLPADKFASVALDSAKKVVVVTFNTSASGFWNYGHEDPVEIPVNDILESQSTYTDDVQDYHDRLTAVLQSKVSNAEPAKASLAQEKQEALEELAKQTDSAEAKKITQTTKEQMSEIVLNLKKVQVTEALTSLSLPAEKEREITDKLSEYVSDGIKAGVENEDLTNPERVQAVETALLKMTQLISNEVLDQKLKETLNVIKTFDKLDGTANAKFEKMANDMVNDLKEQIAQAQDTVNGETAIAKVEKIVGQGINGLAVLKAKANIENEKLNRLEDIENATASENRKVQNRKDLNKLVEELLGNIDRAATTNPDQQFALQDIKNAETDAVEQLQNFPIANAKSEAVEKINAAAQKQLEKIAASTAKVSSKDKANAEVNRIKDEALEKIAKREDTAENKAGTEYIGDKAVFDIENVEIPSVRQDALDEIAAKEAEKKAEIEAANATENAKEKARKQLQTEADQARQVIISAQDDDAINQAKDDGIAKIDAIHTLSKEEELQQLKEEAKQKIDAEKSTRIQKIDASDANDEDKEKAKQFVEEQADNLNKKLESIVNDPKVIDERIEDVKEFIKEIEILQQDDSYIPQAKDLQQARNAAIAKIKKALEEKIQEIDATGADEATKKKYRDVAEKIAQTHLQNVNLAGTIETVRQAGMDGVLAVQQAKIPTGKDLNQLKQEAIDVINNAKNKKLAEIQVVQNAHPEDVAKAEELVEKIAKYAIDRIQNATLSTEIENLRQHATDDISEIALPQSQELHDNSQSKADAINQIKKALQLKEREIDISDTPDKKALKEYAKQIADIEIAKVEATKTDDAARMAGKEGAERVGAIEIPSPSVAGDDQDELAAAKEDAKQSAIAQARKEADAAKKEIALSQNIASVNKEKDKGIQNVAVDTSNPPLPDLTEQKKQAKLAIDEAVKVKKEEIKKTGIDIKKQNDALDQLAEIEKMKVDQAQSEKEITDVTNNAVKIINDFKVKKSFITN